MTVISLKAGTAGAPQTSAHAGGVAPGVVSGAGDLVLPEALQRRLDHTIEEMFALPVGDILSIEEQVTTGNFSADIETVRKPVLSLDRREGALIEGAIRHALVHSPRFIARESVSTEIYLAARDLVDANRTLDDHDAKWQTRLRLTGPAVDSLAIDVVAIEKATGIVSLVEVKRSASGVTDARLRALRSAAFTIRERLIDDGVQVNCVIPRVIGWWGEAKPGVISRTNIDGILGEGIQALVDRVVGQFRTRVSAKMAERLNQPFAGVVGEVPVDQPIATRAHSEATPEGASVRQLTAALAGLDRRRRKNTAPVPMH